VVAPFPDEPSRVVASGDAVPIAVFSAGSGRPLLLVHGTTADHRTWRGIAPTLVGRWRLHAIDRRGRGNSGDAAGYALDGELGDLAAVAAAIAAEAGGPVDVVGHSFGGRLALGASLRTPAIRRVVAYESAPGAGEDAGEDPAVVDGQLARLRADLAGGDLEGLLARFMTEVVGMPAGELAAFRADPVWPLRVAAAPTIIRELHAARHAPAISLDALAEVRVPVLQVVGSDSAPAFGRAAAALHARLADGRLEVIAGARHAAHHSHPAAFVTAIERFLRP
jgi:pimeloyl-ACP methyl ester carboxylesterase